MAEDDKVTMTHPDLPEQPIHVHPSAVPVYEQSGWVLNEDSPWQDSEGGEN